MPARKYSEETLDEMAELREDGMSMAAIARRLDMSVGAIHWHCLRLGADSPETAKKIPTTQGPMEMKRGNHVVRRFTAEEDAMLERLDLEGLRVCEICRQMGRQPSSIRGRLMTLARRQERALNAGMASDAL